MKLYNLQYPAQQVNFAEALRLGLGKHRGLFFPSKLEPLADIDALLALNFIDRSTAILSHFLEDELAPERLHTMVSRAFNFDLPLVAIDPHCFALELFHGPTLAFKDFGARFMAQCLGEFYPNQRITILTATSGDTGAAVAHAFWQHPHIDVVVLYPKDRISKAQEALFCTLGGNVHTYRIAGTFDDCQKLVRQAFDDDNLREKLHLNSANSINISRLLAQACYYFEAIAQFPKPDVIPWLAVPSGNFGNLTAGLIAKVLGLPMHLVVATNSNDTVPRYLASGRWEVAPTQATLSCSMDVSDPNNWPRVQALFDAKGWHLNQLPCGSVNDALTAQAISSLSSRGYLAEPHGAVAWHVLQKQMPLHNDGIFLATAHPAKFADTVQQATHKIVPIPKPLQDAAQRMILSHDLAADFSALREVLLQL